MTKIVSIAAYVAVLGLTTPPAVAQTQQRIELPASPSCRQCTIELTPVARLGGAADSVLLGPNSGAAAATSRGQFLVPAASGDRLAIYDAKGKFIRTLGKRGGGPGEFQIITDVRVGVGDTVIVADQRNGVQVFGPTFEYVRSIRAPNLGAFSRAAVLPTGEIIQQSGIDRLTVLAPSGIVRESIAVVPVPASRSCDRCNRRWLAPASVPGQFWSSVSNRYQIELLDRTGAVRKILTRRPQWFTPWDSIPRDESGAAPIARLPTVAAIREDTSGIVWLLAVVADPKWKEVNTSGPASIRMFNGLDDGLITAIDARAGALLAERRLSGAVGFVGQTGLIFSQEEDDDGFVMIQILRVHLQRQ